MRTLTSFVILASSLAACGDKGSNQPDAEIIVPDSPPPPDAPPPPPPDAMEADFSCENDPVATTAPATVNAGGTVQDVNVQSQMLEPVPGATIKAFKTGQAAPLAMTTSADGTGGTNAGDWNLALTSGGTPIDGFVESSKAQHRTVRLYPPSPLSADLANAPVLLLTSSTFGLLVQFILQDTQDDATNGAAGVVIVDCANNPIPGATLSIKKGGTEVGKQHDASQLQPGAFLVLDVPEGDVVVGGTASGHTLHAHTITVVKGQTSTTVVSPRP